MKRKSPPEELVGELLGRLLVAIMLLTLLPLIYLTIVLWRTGSARLLGAILGWAALALLAALTHNGVWLVLTFATLIGVLLTARSEASAHAAKVRMGERHPLPFLGDRW